MANGKAAYKNPLAQAFGMALRKQRDKMGKSSGEIAEILDIGSSFYRLVESGANNLHISKAVSLVDAFEGRFKFDGISKILMAISIMEVMANKARGDGMHHADGLTLAVEKLSAYDQRKLYPLFLPFIENEVFDMIKNTEGTVIAEEIGKRNIDQKVSEFLLDYESFGKPAEEIQTDYLLKFLNDVPTLYLDFLSDTKESLLKLPVKVGFETLWQWEDRNKSTFKSEIVIVKEHHYVTRQDNLDRYKYRHLWEKQFQQVRFLYMDDVDSKQVKQLFVTNLKNSLERSSEIKMLDALDEKMQKVHFKYCPSENFSFEDLLALELRNEVSEANEFGTNSAWVLTLTNNNNIGFSAYIDSEDALLVIGRSLKYAPTLKLLNRLNELWTKL